MSSGERTAGGLGRGAAVVAALLAVPAAAWAGLQDVGPVNASTGFPQWYRDTGSTALELCTDQRPSPNAEAAGSPLCFPLAPDPAGFPGNLGGEIFYSQSSASLAGARGLSVLWEGAIEATYANGTPIRGDEITFARIRVVMDTPQAGTYRIVHPYGVETFPNVPAGKRSVFYTADVGISPGVFTGALGGAVGPFLRWDQDPANPAAPYGLDAASGLPYALELANLDGTVTSFLGDPNVFHAVTGSPFGTNYVRVEGPPGSNLDGLGNDFVVTNLFATLGQVYATPIALPLQYCRATYGIDANGAKLDVFAEGTSGNVLLFTAPQVPSVELTVDASTGYAYGHAEFAAPAAMPVQGAITNLSDVPHSMVTGPVTDLVTTSLAVFQPDPTGATVGTVAVAVETSVHTATPPTLGVVEFASPAITPDANPWRKTFTQVIPLGEAPPWQITAVSQAGGRHVEDVIFGDVGVRAPAAPFAADLVLATTTGTPGSVTVGDPAYPGASVLVLNPPSNGTAAVAGNVITYTPKPFVSAPDAFTYVLTVPLDPADPASKLVYSNAGTVAVDVGFVNAPPTANADVATTASGTPVVVDVAANDVDPDGAVVPSTVALVTPPFVGSAVANGDGTVTYTPAAGFVGVDTFTYTIRDDLGGVSAPATVSVNVFAQQEQLTMTAQYVTSKARWRANGSSTVFGPGLANVVTVYIGCGVQGLCANPALGAKIGSAVVDPTGAWSIDVIDSTLALDATGQVTAISTGGGKTVARVQVKR